MHKMTRKLRKIRTTDEMVISAQKEEISVKSECIRWQRKRRNMSIRRLCSVNNR